MDKVAWQIAILFAGSALGGHYLGGYEWLRFFTYFGSWGTIGIVLASLGIGWLNLQLLGFCHRHHIRSLYELYLRLFGEAFASSLSVITASCSASSPHLSLQGCLRSGSSYCPSSSRSAFCSSAGNGFSLGREYASWPGCCFSACFFCGSHMSRFRISAIK